MSMMGEHHTCKKSVKERTATKPQKSTKRSVRKCRTKKEKKETMRDRVNQGEVKKG